MYQKHAKELGAACQLATPRLLLSACDAARALSISERTLYSRTKDGTLPCVRLGGRVLYDPRALAAWIDDQRGGAE